ncbi:hypothetical protein AAL_08005 [Moelleriella libera RCEF 2490]|uniref:Uncharacterized protein n=1 Tax=Moelleriella libera RCEF 2490 TaxID=1081109 RepID=A0A167WG26_9HYPO|nr:hypothetical protein AAL_08005 [Moelleriella libera RCEF 2490]
MAGAASLERLVRDDALTLFEAEFQQISAFWSTLSLDTSLTAASSIEEAVSSLKAVNDMIANTSMLYWQRRLAQIQFSRVVRSFEQIIGRQSKAGRIKRRRGHGNATVLLELCRQGWQWQPSMGDIQHRKRLCLRWSILAGGSLFLAFAYSERADHMMQVSCPLKATSLIFSDLLQLQSRLFLQSQSTPSNQSADDADLS